MPPLPLRRLPQVLGIFSLLAVFSACSSPTDPGSGAQSAALTTLPRPLSAGELNVLSASNAFSFTLFQRLGTAQKDTNIFVSPLSASLALGMTMNGAANVTLDQMRSTLGFGAAADTGVNAGYKSLIGLLRGLDNTVDVRIANSIWYTNGFPVKQPFLDAGRTYFDAQIAALDFKSPSAPKTINDWVSSATAGKIPTIVDALGGEVMILVNAIYFKGSWRSRFDPAETTDQVFHGVAGDQPMRLMHRHGSVSFRSTQDYSAVDLPYGDSAFTMTVVVPGNGVSLESVAASLMQPTAWMAMVSQMRPVTIDVFLPKLKLEWQRKLNDDLIALGMRDAFSDTRADFSRLSSVSTLIDYVKQKTYVDIDEEGTEAAAVTSVGIVLTSLGPQFRADHPFIFVIRERLTGTIMFMGKIVRMP
ncbi:serpin family protein [soil metagenome]